jgi:glycosyltransferase involved in cell wall biosynthesis
MRILTISNLYPRPDQPQRGLFNAQLFRAAAQETGKESGVRSQGAAGRRSDDQQLSNLPTQQLNNSLINICLVPEWRVWRWPAIRQWEPPSGFRFQVSGFRTHYVPVFYLPLIGRSLSASTYGWTLRGIHQRIQGSDVVLATWLCPDGVAAGRLARAHGRPYWIKAHGSDRFHLRNTIRRRLILDACRRATGVFANCQYIADALIEAGVDSSRVHVVPNGVDTELFHWRSREEAERKLSVTGYHLPSVSCRLSSAKTVLFVGNLVPVKGPDVMLEAWQRVVASGKWQVGSGERSRDGDAVPAPTPTLPHPHTPTLLIIGDGPMRKRLERRAGALGIGSSVTFLGSRPHEEIALWMNVADCLCVTSRSEGLPNVVLEALASGLPVVATDVGACSELLADEPAARVVVGRGVRSQESGVRGHASGIAESEDIEVAQGIAAALRDVLETTVDREAMARQHESLFSWERSAQLMLELIAKRT